MNGRDISLGVHGTQPSKDKYNRLIAEWIASGRQPPRPQQSITISEVLAAFWLHAETYYRKPHGTPTSERDNYRDALSPLRRLYAATR